MPHRRGESGQAGIEYLTVVGLVAGVLAFGGAVLGGRMVASAAVGQLHRALCVVAGHDCAAARPACTVSGERTGESLSLDVAVVHLAGGRTALLERRSDGTVR